MEATLYLGEIPLVTSPLRLSRGKRGVLDAGVLEVLTTIDDEDRELSSLGYQVDRPIGGYHSMWVEAIESEAQSDLHSLCRISVIGLASAGEKRQRRLRAFGRVVSVGPIEKVILVVSDEETGTDPDTEGEVDAVRRIPKVDSAGEVEYKTISTPTGNAERWNVNEPIIQVEDTYFTTTKPDISVIGGAFALTDAPTPPAYIWGGYNEPLRMNHPNGWVLDNRESIEHFQIDENNGLWEVTDSVSYYQIGQPD